MEYVCKISIFGLKMMMKIGLEKIFLKFLHDTEGSGQFMFAHIHEKTIPAHPRVFLGSPGLC